MSSFSVLAVGFMLGVKHATEADHLAAVATLATGNATLPQALRLGLAWGIGHTTTLLAIAGAVVVIGGQIPATLLPLLEALVGVMLIALGLDVLRRLAGERRRQQAGTAPVFPDYRRLRFRQQDSRRAALPATPLMITGLPRRALAVGMMHGMAGSAALTVLSLHSVSSIWEGLVYISLFGLGSILGMAGLSVVLALPLRWSSRLPSRVNRGLTAAIGMTSVLLGFWTLYRSMR